MRCSLSLLFALPSLLSAAPQEQAGVAFFEAHIRPLLVEHCYECHSTEKGQSKGGLVLDQREGWRTGGDSGPAIVPGKPEESLLLKAVRYLDAELSMPPRKTGGKLPAEAIAKLEAWIAMGAPDPRDGTVKKLTGLSDEARAHWAFQPVVAPPLPAVKDVGWCQTEVDRFVLAKLEASGLRPNQAAKPEALLRRMSYDLWGLPPTTERVAAFVQQWKASEGDPVARRAAVERVVDELLNSPHYGERWGRHWLDTARYSDTRGLVSINAKYRFEDYRYMYAWTYRDYVVAAMNDDKPYDHFILEQLAADQLPDLKPNDARLAALGFITVGRKFDNPHDVIDEQIDTTTKAFLGLTVSCARCHDHKFDPVPIADYYALHGVFASIEEPYEKPELKSHAHPRDVADYQAKLRDLEERNRLHFYDMVQARLDQFSRELEARVLLHGIIAAFGSRSPEAFDLEKQWGITPVPEIDNAMSSQTGHPVWGPLNQLGRLWQRDREHFSKVAPLELRKALEVPGVNPLIARELAALVPENLEEVSRAYVGVMQRLNPQFHALLAARRKDASVAMDEATLQICTSIWPMPSAREIATTEQLMALYQKMPLTGETVNGFLFSQINELRLTHPGAPGCAMVVRDVPNPRDSRVFLRGDAHKPGAVVARQFLECLSFGKREPFRAGSGRYELAKHIASKDNPLTARVAVNRVWQGHFGEGFVRTPDDLGNMSEKPSHPELLDYLSTSFMANGWSLKRLHRLILLSSAYQQSADPRMNPDVERAEKTDAENRLLWRANLRRLDFEGIRDSLLALTGKLDTAVGGKPVNITDEPFRYRRSLYGYVDRLFLSDLPTQFDFADPMMPTSRRISTIVPQQALFFMNNPLTIDVARNVLAREECRSAKNDRDRLIALYHILFQRAPSEEELRLGAVFLKKVVALPAVKELKPAGATTKPLQGLQAKSAMLQNRGEAVARTPLTPWELLAHAMLCSNEFVVVN